MPPPPEGVCAAQVQVLRGGQARGAQDWLAEERPVALVFNGISHAVMLASPCDLEDFALGFALSEGLLAQADELYGIEQRETEGGIELLLQVSSACEWRLRERRRSLAGRTGCGLCGSESLAQLTQMRETLAPLPAVNVSAEALGRAQQALRSWQTLQRLTGATHAAAWCGLQGEVRLVREDIGRHNALDKLLGAMRRAGVATGDGFVCITSRASFEMVQKSARLGVAVLAAVSAPTALAVDTARACGQLLAGFVRGDGAAPDLVVYTHAERLR